MSTTIELPEMPTPAFSTRDDMFAAGEFQRWHSPQVELFLLRIKGHVPADYQPGYFEREYGVGNKFDIFEGDLTWDASDDLPDAPLVTITLTEDQVRLLRMRADTLVERGMKGEKLLGKRAMKALPISEMERFHPVNRQDFTFDGWIAHTQKSGWYVEAVPNGIITLNQDQVEAMPHLVEYWLKGVEQAHAELSKNQ